MISIKGIVLHPYEEKVLLLKNHRGWDFPGGKIDAEDACFNSAFLRELQEETDLCARVLSEPFCYNEFPHPETGQIHGCAYILAQTIGNELENTRSKLTEHDDLVWAPPSELTQYDVLPSHLPAVRSFLERLEDMKLRYSHLEESPVLLGKYSLYE